MKGRIMWPIYRRNRHYYQTHVDYTDEPILSAHRPSPGNTAGASFVALNPQPLPPEPDPQPWLFAASDIIALVSLKQVAEGNLAKQINGKITAVIDDYCGNEPRRIHIPRRWPWPGPDPGPLDVIYGIASELSWAANTLQEGRMRKDLLDIAGQVLQRAGSVK
jgi:hypothetical protein